VGPLDGKWRSLVGKVGEWYMKNRHLQDCNPRLCLLRTDNLTPRASIERTYRMLVYGPTKPNSLTCRSVSHLTCGSVTPTASMAGSREKLDTDPWIGQPS
jgi:hypothetical protein